MESSTVILISQDPGLIENTKQWAENHSVRIQVFSPNEWEGQKTQQNKSSFYDSNVPRNSDCFQEKSQTSSLGSDESKDKVIPNISFQYAHQTLDSNSESSKKGHMKRVKTMGELENIAIQEAIREFQGNLTEASKALGIGRATLYRKVKQYNIDLTATRKKIAC